mmetsp:Transcript_32361/g.30866  ORF Transcript_32361/g.30866 Transcript_32361/m.30866 type:complete len:576 (+) Transcript_32361:83-1810(+)
MSGDEDNSSGKRSRSPSTRKHQENQANQTRPSSSRPMKKTNKPTLVELAAVKYAKGSMKHSTKHVKYKGLRKTLEETQDRIVDAAMKTAATEVLLPTDAGCIKPEGNEKTYRLKQQQIINEIDMNTSKNCMDLQLTKFGPYKINYSKNGRFMLFGGKKGHVAVLDCLRTQIGTELQLQEEVHDVHYLHNETMFAVAQNKYTYIYDHKGVEIHCMKRHERPYKLDFLPYHYLLTTVGHSGWVKWHDVSTGEYVTGYQTGHGPCKILKNNPVNAVSHLGHSNGVVSLWSPAAGKPLVSIFAHKSPVTDLAIDREGKYMATSGLDSMMKIWDLRMFKCLHSYKTDHPAMSLDISDRNLIAMAVGRSVHVLQDAFTKPTDLTYLKHTIRTPNPSLSSGGGVTASTKFLASSISTGSVKFRPYEDILAVGHTHGLSTIIVPGAGEPNFDSFESNPFQNTKQRQEGEVQTLLNKLSHEMIGLDSSFVGTLDKDQESLKAEHQAIFYAANERVEKEKNKKRGRNKISAKLRRKQKNVVDAATIKLKEKLQKERDDKESKKEGFTPRKTLAEEYGVLSRFVKK